MLTNLYYSISIWFYSLFVDQALLAETIIYSLIIIILILVFLAAKYSISAENYQRLYHDSSKESRLLARLKNVYEVELKTFANLMDEITFPIWQRDGNMNIIYCNRRFCEITGEIRENIISKGEQDLFRDSKEIAKRALKTGQVQMIEQNIVIAGSNTLNQVVEIPVSDTSHAFGNKNGTIGFALNLVELQNTRERLKSNMELQKRLLESLNSAVVIYGVNQKIEYYNQAFINLWKFDEDWLRTYPTYGEILEALRDKRKLPEQVDFSSFKRDNINMFSNLLNKKEDYYYLNDGRVLKVIIIPYQNRGLLFYYEDMTEKLSLERSYNTLVSVQKYTLDNLNEAVAVFGEDGKLELFNPNFMKLWGFTESFLRSEPHISRILEEMVVFFNFANARSFKEEFTANLNSREFIERKIDRKDDKILIERFTPLPDGAKLITYFDITDKENVEKSLRAEKMAYEEADKIKTNFLGNVSYELRSPLTSIMGFAEMMLSMYADKLDKKTLEYTKAIFDSSHKLKNLIDNIIDVSSFDAGYITLKANSINVSDFIEPVIKGLKTEITKKKLSLNTDIEKNIGGIKVDVDRLRHAVKTVANVSILTCRQNGKIDINISKKENIIFKISNDGNGIPQSDIAKIFDQFYKLHTDKSEIGGLDLYLAKKIIEVHLGKISVESEPGRGISFIIEIPAHANSV